MKRNKSSQIRMNSIFRGNKTAVAKSVTAFVRIQLCFYRLPSGSPYSSVVTDEIITSVCVCGYVVIAVSCQTEKFCIFVEAVSSACIGNERKEIFISEIIDPRQWSFRGCDDIFFGVVIKMSEFHKVILLVDIYLLSCKYREIS